MQWEKEVREIARESGTEKSKVYTARSEISADDSYQRRYRYKAPSKVIR
jgi:hypothetical protein